MRMKVRKKMCRFLALIIMLCMGSSAYAETPTAEAQKKVAAYLTLLDDMCFTDPFLSYGFAQDPGKSWKEGLEKLEYSMSQGLADAWITCRQENSRTPHPSWFADVLCETLPCRQQLG